MLAMATGTQTMLHPVEFTRPPTCRLSQMTLELCLQRFLRHRPPAAG
jgi:hypothetical protein